MPDRQVVIREKQCRLSLLWIVSILSVEKRELFQPRRLVHPRRRVEGVFVGMLYVLGFRLPRLYLPFPKTLYVVIQERGM